VWWRWWWRRSPLSSKEFPGQIPACRRAFLSLVFSASQRRRCLSLNPPWLRFSGTIKYAKGRNLKWARVAT
jgi:hypothetical protein